MKYAISGMHAGLPANAQASSSLSRPSDPLSIRPISSFVLAAPNLLKVLRFLTNPGLYQQTVILDTAVWDEVHKHMTRCVSLHRQRKLRRLVKKHTANIYYTTI